MSVAQNILLCKGGFYMSICGAKSMSGVPKFGVL
jgi:hypothetical protein